MANQIFPVGTDRDNLKLVAINENGTISEMIKTIDENFKNIAAHGGGPDGLPGKDGINGTDGTSAEYIFALCDDEPIAGENYPANDAGKANLFDGVEFSATGSVWFPSNSNKITEWHDHPQGVSKEHKNEYVFSRYRRSADESIWFYAEKPELWAHWGETGKDGDGVEYIFLRSKGEISSSNLKNLIKTKSELDSVQSIIYQLDDFFPGSAWFRNSNNKTAARQAIIAKLGSLPSDFDQKWEGNYGMIAGNGSYNWSDDPKGTDAEYTHEYVSIRRCNVDDQDAKEWSDFSPAALWSVYSQSSTTIIIYCNTNNTVTNENITAPQRGEGHWDSGNRTLTLPERLTSYGWTDTNENAGPNEITWLCSGLFDNSGNNVYWSKPMRITGKDGKQGEDGLNTEFIYILSNSMPEYPDPTNDRDDVEALFNNVENGTSGRVPETNAKYYDDTYGQRWYDRAQPISAENHTEYIWARRRDTETSPWEYDPEPIIWAHWGEDGTDGDGVEYIFYITDTDQFEETNNPPKISEVPGSGDLNICKRLIYNIDDFVPNSTWFNDTNKAKVIKSIEDKGSAAGITVANFEVIWNNQVSNGTYFGFAKGWKDNPIKVDGLNPYQWVSIRRSTADEETGGKRLWEDFSDPVLWSSYGKTTRAFIVYCNVAEGVTPKRPEGGYWNVNASSGVILALNEQQKDTPFTSNATDTVTPEDKDYHINVWEDDNIDVRGTISWMSSGIFSDDGNLIGTWSSPFRITGYKGENGADGSNIEFIYAICDEMPKYPNPNTNPQGVLDTFFDDVNDNNTGYWPSTGPQENATKWTDNPTGISDEPGHRTEWVWSRSLAVGDSESESVWVYAPKPTIWSRWGEDGTDGDGVEYIFFASTNKPLLDGTGGTCNQLPPKVSKIIDTDDRSKQKRLIYNISDFCPNISWFLNNREEIYKELLNGDCGITSQTDFDTVWANEVEDDNGVYGPCFDFNVGMCNPGDQGWTDNPSDVDFEHPYEYVSIRKTVNDPESGKKIWGDFSDPKIWGTYNMKTRMFVVYCNMNEGETPSKPEDGWWDVESDKLLPDITDFELKPRVNGKSLWKDTTEDEPGKIAYLSSGMFAENGQNIFWSEPFRLTGEKGKPGADGSTIEFVYCLSDEMPKYPNPQDYNACIAFFEEVNINNSAYYPESGNKSFWTDNPRGISNEDGKRTEWVWSRSLANGSSESEDNLDWSFPPKPVIWSHWGEDGTDGDGVEYIFILKNNETDYPDENAADYESKLSIWNTFWDTNFTGTNASDMAKVIYGMDDFIPNSTWFNDDNKDAVRAEMGDQFDENDWGDIQELIIQAQLGNWRDNPGSVSISNRYQYVSIRKTINDPEDPSGKIWGPFSYPTLWGKYNITTFKSFAFTSTKIHDDISNLQPIGGTFGVPIPDDTTYNGTTYVWTDGPSSTDEKPLVWMTSATFDENLHQSSSPTWSSPKKMVDTSTFQVEWSITDPGNDLASKIESLKQHQYNFGLFLDAVISGNSSLTDSQIEDRAEAAWRYVVKNGYTPGGTYPPESYLTGSSFTTSIGALGLEFGDGSDRAVLMATCQLTNGLWTEWKLVKVKGEQGDPGTGINPKGVIAYEVYFDNSTTYTYNSASTKFEAVKSSISIPVGKMAIVYPKEANSDGIYYGDSTMGGGLYMKMYTANGWVDYYTEQNIGNQENTGDTYTSPNGHLIMWDGDSWQDIGRLTGPAGPVSKILVRYANDKSGGGYEFASDIPSAKYVGFITYPEDMTPAAIEEANITQDNQIAGEPYWIWIPFHGQDGFGYEFIYKATPENNAPSLPTHNTSWEPTANVIPNGWVDEPIEPTKDNKYVWMCWRKYNHSTKKWTAFVGNTTTGKARLWQVYQKALNSVTELYHADQSSSPSATNHNAQRPESTGLSDWLCYWVGYSSSASSETFENVKNHTANSMWVNPVGNDGTVSTALDPDSNTRRYNLWGTTNCHLFNRELISYSDGTYFASAPHYVATWEDGIIDIQEYYILEAATANGGDPGDVPPHCVIDQTTGEVTSIDTTGQTAGKDYWTLGSSLPKMDKDWPVLWNINKKIYRGAANGDEITKWTTPLVIGTYGEGTNGEDAIYVDLDNEMDSIQIDENNKVIISDTYSTTVRLYQGETLLRIGDIDISGEEAIMENGYTLTYYYDDGTNPTLKGSATFNSYGICVSGTDILNNSSTKLTHDINCIKITFTVNENDVLTSIHNKISITVAHIEKGSTLEIARRQTSYTFIGIVNSPVYSILTKESAIIESTDNNDNRVLNPASFAVSVIKKNGPKTETITSYSGASADFRLYVTSNSNASTWLSTMTNGSFIVPSSIYGPTYLSAGDKLTFAINIDTVGQSGDFETTVDRETVYVLKQGVDGVSGSDGTPGNGYQYKYIQYLNASSDWYNGVSCTVTQTSTTASPVFKIGTRDVTSTVTSYPQGADATHMYEWRSERYGYGSENAATWSRWSDPVTVAKYLDEGSISAAVATEISAQSETIASIARNSLDSTIDDVESLMSKFDENGYIKDNYISGSTKAGIVNGYLKTSDFGSTLQTNIGGVTITASGQTKTFSEWINYENGEIASVYTSLDAINGTLSNVVTKSELSNVTTAVQTLRADAHDRFAEIDSTVANATFATDDEGYLLVDMPIYTTWYPIGTSLQDPDGRRDVEWVLFRNSSSSTGTINTLAPLVKNEEDYYNGTDKTKRVVVLYKDIPYNSISNYIGTSTSANTFANDLQNIIIRLKKLGNDFEFRESPDGINKYNETTTPTASLSSTYVRLIIYTTVTIAYGTPVDEYLEFTHCDWTVGVGKIGSSVSTVSLAHTVTGSVFEEPLLKSYDSTGYNDVFSKVNNTLYGSSGYILYKDGDTVKEVDTNDKVTITSSYPFKVIKETNGANTLTKEQLKNALTKGIYYDISDYVLTAGNEMTYTIDVSANSTYYIAFNYSGTKTISYNLSNYGCSQITFNDDYIIDQSIMYDIVIKPSKLTLGTEGMYDWGRSPITIKEDKTIYSGIDYSDFFQKSVTFIDLSVSQKDTEIEFKMTTDTPSNTGNYKYLLLNHIFTEREINTIFNDANEVANNITVDGDVKVSPNYFTREYITGTNEQKGFLNNINYGTENRTTWNSWATPITIDFSDGILSNDGRYHITFVQYYWDGYSTSQLISNFKNKMEITDYSVTSSSNFWEGANITTTDGTTTRTSTEMYYTLDKLTVTHQAAAPLVPSNVRRKARDMSANIEPGVKAYIDVYDIDKPYLITSVTELATISQTVSDGIACTEIITGAGSNSAAAVFQATPDGSSINFLADTVGIESSHFKLNKTDGLWMDGDINVRSLTTNSGNTQITEDGTLYAKNAIIEGNITANNFLATTSYENSDSIVTKTAVMNAEKFEVTSNAINVASGTTESAKIYITVLDELDMSQLSGGDFIANSGGTATNIPTLCFDYHGITYYLNPEMWWIPQNASSDPWLTTDIYYNLKNDIYTEISLVKNTLSTTGRDYVDSGITSPSGIGSVTLYKYDPDNDYRTKIEKTIGKKYEFGYSAGSLSSSDASALQTYLANKQLIWKTTNNEVIRAVAVNVSSDYQYNVKRKQHIDGANGLSSSSVINDYNNQKFTTDTNNKLYEILDNRDYGYWEVLSGTSISTTITSNFNSYIINYLKNTFFSSGSSSTANWYYRDTDLLPENPSDPITYIANPFNTLASSITIINDGDSYAEITVNGAYEQKYSNGSLSTQTIINGFVECAYTFNMFLNNNGIAYGIPTKNNITAYLKQITINVTFGLYLTNIVPQSGNTYKQTILNALKNVNLTSENIGKAVHINAILEYWTGSSNVTIIGNI